MLYCEKKIAHQQKVAPMDDLRMTAINYMITEGGVMTAEVKDARARGETCEWWNEADKVTEADRATLESMTPEQLENYIREYIIDGMSMNSRDAERRQRDRQLIEVWTSQELVNYLCAENQETLVELLEVARARTEMMNPMSSLANPGPALTYISVEYDE